MSQLRSAPICSSLQFHTKRNIKITTCSLVQPRGFLITFAASSLLLSGLVAKARSPSPGFASFASVSAWPFALLQSDLPRRKRPKTKAFCTSRATTGSQEALGNQHPEIQGWLTHTLSLKSRNLEHAHTQAHTQSISQSVYI